MDIRPLVRQHEAAMREALGRQEAERQRQENEARELRRLHAQRLQEALTGIALPVLQEGARQLHEVGYQATVNQIRKDHPLTGLKELVLEVQLTCNGKRGKAKARYELRYAGDVEHFVVNGCATLDGPSIGFEGSHNMPVASLSTEIVNQHFEQFVVAVLKHESELAGLG